MNTDTPNPCSAPDVRNLFTSTSRRDVKAAKAICAGCSVRESCLQAALDLKANGPGDGVWGGATPRDRRKLTQAPAPKPTRQRKPINHGTPSGYEAHRRRHEEPCADCKKVMAEKAALQRKKARERQRDELAEVVRTYARDEAAS